MSDSTKRSADDDNNQSLDLNSLSGLDFGPSWADGSKPSPQKQKDPGHSGGSRSPAKDKGSGARDRRKGAAAPRRGDKREGGRDPRRSAPQKPFEPTVEVDLYPQDEAFDALVKRLRSTARTYQLFEIAQLILEKPERFVVVVSHKKRKGEEAAPLYYSVPGHLPFETEEAAVEHVMKHHLDRFFEIEAIEVDPPKGNFLMVNRCTITGELLGPPNYHRYQEFLQRHYTNRITGMPFDRFVSKVETVKEQEVIDQWLESMKQGFRYIPRERSEGDPASFESLEAARMFLLQQRKSEVVGSDESVRFAGRDIERMPQGDLRRSVEVYIEQQRRFPLDTANNIRGRLRRHKFTVYKKGSKGVSYVCAVKRKFRDSGTVFTDSIRELIEFIESNPNTPAAKLPKLFIGIDTERQKPEKLNVSEDQIRAEKEARDNQTGPDEGKREADTGEPAVAEQSASGSEPEDEPKPELKAAEVSPKDDLSESDQKKLKQLMLDLRWLITEGYVTEYGDGRLFAPPPMPEPKKKAPDESKAPEAAKTADPKTETQDGPEESEAALAPEDSENPEARKEDMLQPSPTPGDEPQSKLEANPKEEED